MHFYCVQSQIPNAFFFHLKTNWLKERGKVKLLWVSLCAYSPKSVDILLHYL